MDASHGNLFDTIKCEACLRQLGSVNEEEKVPGTNGTAAPFGHVPRSSDRRGNILSLISAEREIPRLERDRLAIIISRGATFLWY